MRPWQIAIVLGVAPSLVFLACSGSPEEHPSGTLWGHVVDEDGWAKSNAIVKLFDDTNRVVASTMTLRDGEFVFAGVDRSLSRKFTVAASPWFRKGGFQDVLAANIDSTGDIRLEVERSLRLSGRVLDHGGAPIANAHVVIPSGYAHNVWVPSALGPELATRTDASGRFDFSNVKKTLDSTATIRTERNWVFHAELGSPPTKERDWIVEIRLPEAVGTIVGKVTLNDVPIPAFIEWRGESMRGIVRASKEGWVRIEGVEAGRVELTPRHAIPEGLALTGTEADDVSLPGFPEDSAVVQVHNDERVEHDFALATHGEIDGGLFAMRGAKIQGIRIIAVPIPGSVAFDEATSSWDDPTLFSHVEASVLTDERGRFKIPVKWLATDYIVCVAEPGYLHPRFVVRAGMTDLELVAMRESAKER